MIHRRNQKTAKTEQSFEKLKNEVREAIDEAVLNGAERLKKATRRAVLGETGEIEYLKDYIRNLLVTDFGITRSNISKIISFDNPSKMSPVELFEYTYMVCRRTHPLNVFPYMAEELDLIKTDKDELERPYYVIGAKEVRNAYLKLRVDSSFADMLDTLVQRVYEMLYGHDVADLLIMDDDLDGVSAGVGGRTRVEYNYLEELYSAKEKEAPVSKCFDVIYVVYKGRNIRMVFLSFESEERLKRVVNNIYRYNAKVSLSKKNPVITASFGNSSRVVVTRPPVSDSWTFFVRKFGSSNARNLEELIGDCGSYMVIRCLKRIVMSEANFVISGNTGGGKTTLLKALVGFINPAYNIRVAETSFELNLNNIYPDRNIQCMQERGDFSVYDAITASKKMDTDVLILGEVNEPKVAGAFIQIAQSGSRMAITTLHHETTKKLIEYMRNALISEFGITDPKIAERQVVDSIEYDIHMVHDVEGHHYIERITEIKADDDYGYRLRNVVWFDTDKKEYRSINDHF